ncbi:putative nucleic acid-binding, replication factor A [Helianthus anomalus]
MCVDRAYPPQHDLRIHLLCVGNTAILFRNVVEITSIRTKNSWYLFACSGSQCRKGLTREEGYFVCKACKSKVDYPRTRYILHHLIHKLITLFPFPFDIMILCWPV